MAAEHSQHVRLLVRRLGRLRARIRGIFLVIGSGRWIVAAVGVLTLFFLADWLLDLPLGVRQFVRLGLLDQPAEMAFPIWLLLLVGSGFLAVALTRSGRGAAGFFSFVAAGVVGLLAWMAARFFLPLRTQLSDDELALSVEARFGRLKDRLAAALDFERELKDPRRGESEAMMAHVVGEAAQVARSMKFAQAATGRRAIQWAGAATLALVVAVSVASVFPSTVGLWFERSILLQEKAWPRQTTVLAVDLAEDGSLTPHDPAVTYAVPIGRPLTVYALAEGDVPDEAFLLDFVAGQQPLARRMFSVPEREGLFALEFRDVRRPFSFVLHGGDDDDEIPRYRVEITIPPKVLSIASTITYPDYLGKAPETLADGNVTVPEGAKVAVAFDVDVEIAEAEVVMGEESLRAAPGAPVGAEGAKSSFRFAFEAKATVHYRLLLRTPDGKENDPAADTYHVRVKPDQPPRVDWTYPRGLVEATPNGRVPLLVRATDDHAIASLVLEARLGGEKTTRFSLQPYQPREDMVTEDGMPVAVNDGEYGRPQVLSYLAVDLEPLRSLEGERITAPTRVAFRFIARDTRGQVREGEWTSADVSSAAELERGLAGRRTNVRQGLSAVRREQEARRKDVDELLKGPIGAPELDLLKTIQFAQGKIAQDVDRSVQDLIAIFNAFVYDRLGAENPNAKILERLDQHHRRTYGLEQGAEGNADRMATREAWKGDPVFPYDLYEQIVQDWRDKIIYDKGLLDRMLAVMEDAVAIGARLAPEAHRRAATAVSGNKQDLEALRQAQLAHLNALERLLDSMKGWQSLSDLTLDLRRIIDAQKTFGTQLDEKDKSDK